jgi:hypothetical protein
MDTSTNGRVAAARSRAVRAKRLLAGAAVALFAAVLVGARVSHPGQTAAAGSAGTTAVDQTSNDSEVQSFDFGQSNIGPSSGSNSGTSGTTHAS